MVEIWIVSVEATVGEIEMQLSDLSWAIFQCAGDAYDIVTAASAC